MDKKLNLLEVLKNVFVGRKVNGGRPLSPVRQENTGRDMGSWLSRQKDAARSGSQKPRAGSAYTLEKKKYAADFYFEHGHNISFGRNNIAISIIFIYVK